jgi:hypothetical protein
MADPMGVSPVFVREFRSRMRHPWAYGVLVAYLAALTPAGLYFLYQFNRLFAHGEGVQEVYRNSQQVGVIFALALFSVQFLLVTLLVPGLTCLSFTTERIKRQLLFVLLTPLSSRGIVVGKLLSSLFYVMLLLLATVPLCALSSQFGGLSPFDLVTGYAALFAYTLMVAAYGLYVSAKDHHGGRAALWAYLGVLAVPVLFPCLLVPFSGLYSLLVNHDTVLITEVCEAISIPVMAIPFSLVFWLAAQWFIGETAALLDVERRLWGTYAPPLPLHEGKMPAAPPPVDKVAVAPEPEQAVEEPPPPLPAEKRKRW